MQKPDKQNSRKARLLASRVTFGARAIFAFALLLTLVTGSIVWPAAASRPLCMLACCAGRAPHVAGSCMDGTCETSGASNKGSHSQHHHSQAAQASDSDNNSQQVLAGVTAGACGIDMEQVETIEAPPSKALADEKTLAVAPEGETNSSRLSATVISQQCQPECGACTSSFVASKRSRNTATLAGSRNALPPPTFRRAGARRPLMNATSVYSRQSVPRGPPSSFS